MARPNEILDRQKIGIEISRRIHDKNTRTIDVLVSKLRKKIDSPNGPSIIATVRNAGYVFILSGE